MSLVVADSTSVFSEGFDRAAGDEGMRPAVVYLDPMFPHRKKSALVKKGMQMLQGLLGEEDERRRKGALGGSLADDGDGDSDSDSDADVREAGREERALFDVAMRLASRRVVVKRPVKGPAVTQRVVPSHSVVSKNARFDVYAVP